jgi:NAD(P)-dependent dehydrogenase (short-subunit alcohol dehydrogenase family)
MTESGASASLAGKVVIVTGPARRNIGFHAAAALRARGATLAIMGRNAEAVATAAEELGGDTLPLTADLTDRDAILAAIAKTEQHFGRIDGIVNNAGVSYAGRVEVLNPKQIDHQVELNFLAAVHACQAVIPCMRRQGGGRIVNVSSAIVHRPDAFSHISIYRASKAALEHFTDALRDEVQRDNIAVTCFIPGDTGTGFGRDWDEAARLEAYADWLERGTHFEGLMRAEVVGEQIARCFDLPLDHTIEFMLVRPVGRHRKYFEEDPS